MIRSLQWRMLVPMVAMAPLACGVEAQEPVASSAPAPVAYLPSVADLMTSAIETRHAKLGMAIAARNWTYSAYEVRELRTAFARIVRTIPVYEKQPTDALMLMAAAPIDALEAAIKANDAKGSDRAYVALTATCNACHQSLKRDYIEIVAPRASMFPNQNFKSAR
jgi:hypothetical protein